MARTSLEDQLAALIEQRQQVEIVRHQLDGAIRVLQHLLEEQDAPEEAPESTPASC